MSSLEWLGIKIIVAIIAIAIVYRLLTDPKGVAKWFKTAGKRFSGILNPYSLIILSVMVTLIVWGALLIYTSNMLGLIPFLMGVMMVQGFKWPPKADPSKVWLITVFGQMTTIRTYGLTLLFDWIPYLKIVSYVEFTLLQVDMDINLRKPIRCQNGKYIEGFLSVSVVPDDEDDAGRPAPDVSPKSGGEKLRDFKNIGEYDGIKRQLDDILTNWVQHMGNDMDSEEMEKQEKKLGETMLKFVTGQAGAPDEIGNSTLDDARSFGARFPKFQLVLKAPDKVIDSRVAADVETEKRKAQKVVTETVNQQIIDRLKLYRLGKKEDGIWIVKPTPEEKIPSLAEIRNMVVQENLMQDDKVTQVINRDGINVVNAGGGS